LIDSSVAEALDLADQLAWIGRLVAHDTTSRRSNLGLIEDVEGYLAGLGVETWRAPSPDGTKSNLYAAIGPSVPGGVVLSGHTDVVPVDGQAWSSDPWTVEIRDGKLYGRGTADMKSFLAISLSLAPDMLAAPLRRPVILALSYDEEVGCLGAPAMIAEIAEGLPRPSAVIVGEPTEMRVVDGHKGIAAFRTEFIGAEAHSSQTDRGVSAVMAAGRFIAALAEIGADLAAKADPASRFHPGHTTLTANVVEGGTAVNIMAGRCAVTWDLRSVPGEDRSALRGRVDAAARRIEADMRAVASGCAVRTETLADAPPLRPEPGNPASELAIALTGANRTQTAAYAAEAGQFQDAGLSAVLCGPGSIDQAHQADEFIHLDQVRQGTAFVRRLIAHLSN